MDWIAGFLELLGSWLIGNKRKTGFISTWLGCACWVYIAFHKEVYGLLLVVIPALIINARNYYKWWKSER